MRSKNSKILFVSIFAVLLASLGIFLKIKGDNDKRLTVPIAMALDDGYTYPTIVAITSMMENKNPDTRYDYYIMHPGEFKEENKEKLRSLEKKYQKCKINLIDMEDKYKDANDKGAITTPTYYRLSLSDLLPDLDKIIWLDGDTITFSDLKEMYDIDMRGYYYKGFLDFQNLDYFAQFNDHYICAGVMLLNLSELRKDNVVDKFSKFIKENDSKLSKHDQTTINAVCGDKNGVLPPKYGIFNIAFGSYKEYIEGLKCKEKYTEDELMRAYKDPVVLHTTMKPWKSKDVYGFDKWWEYAKKTDYYEEILKKYPIL